MAEGSYMRADGAVPSWLGETLQHRRSILGSWVVCGLIGPD